ARVREGCVVERGARVHDRGAHRGGGAAVSARARATRLAAEGVDGCAERRGRCGGGLASVTRAVVLAVVLTVASCSKKERATPHRRNDAAIVAVADSGAAPPGDADFAGLRPVVRA